MVEPSSASGSLADRLFSGTLWMFGMRWMVRLLSLINVVILARLLSQADFGLAAMATAVVALATTLLEFGVEQAIIREHKPTAGLYDTAWTVRFLQFLAVAAVVFLIAPLAADFYSDARITEIMEVLALAILIRGMESMWVVSFRKEFKFHRDFYYQVGNRLLNLIIVVALAYWLRSYWALVYGQVATFSVRFVMSLVLTRRWPRPTLSHWRTIWSFSQWSLLKGLATYIASHADRLMLGRMTDTETVGVYTIGRQVAEIPLTEISGPANRSLGPGFSELQHERSRLAWALAKAIGAVATIAVPLSLGLAVTAQDAVHVMLGERWLPSAPILQVLAAAAMLTTVRQVMENMLVVTGLIRVATIVVWFRALSFLAMALPLTMQFGAVGMAWAFSLSAVVTLLVAFGFVHRHLPQFTVGRLLSPLARPLLSGFVMCGAVLAAAAVAPAEPYLRLAIEVLAGAVSYAVALLGMWLVAGRPDGLERVLLERARRLKRRL